MASRAESFHGDASPKVLATFATAEAVSEFVRGHRLGWVASSSLAQTFGR